MFEILQNECLTTKLELAEKKLFTGGLVTCVGLLIRATGWVSIAHLDGSPMIYQLTKTINTMKQANPENPIVADVFTCTSTHEPTLNRLLEIIHYHDLQFSIIEADEEQTSVAFDTEGGWYETGVTNDGTPRASVVHPDWSTAWNRSKPSQWPMLKRITQEQKGVYSFDPDQVETYLARCQTPHTPVDPNHAEAEATFTREMGFVREGT